MVKEFYFEFILILSFSAEFAKKSREKMSQRKPFMLSCIGTNSVKKFSFDESEDSKKRKINEESDEETEKKPNKFKFKPSQSSEMESKPKYAPKPFNPPKVVEQTEPKFDENDELGSIDAYFAAIEKQNKVYERPKLPPGAPLR